MPTMASSPPARPRLVAVDDADPAVAAPRRSQVNLANQAYQRIEEMLIVHEKEIEIISNFPVKQITVVDPMPGYGDHVK